METPAKYQIPQPPGQTSQDDSASPFPLRTELLGAIHAYTGALGAGWHPDNWVELTLVGELCERIAHARVMVERFQENGGKQHEPCGCVHCTNLQVAAVYDVLPEAYQRLVQTCQEEAERNFERTLMPEEAAEILRVNPQTVYRNLRAGKLPGGKVGTNWRIARRDLEEYLRFGGLPGRSQVQNEWKVWSWVPEGPRPTGELWPAFWYEECSCRNQTDAEKVKGLFERTHPSTQYRTGKTKPSDIPDEPRP